MSAPRGDVCMDLWEAAFLTVFSRLVLPARLHAFASFSAVLSSRLASAIFTPPLSQPSPSLIHFFFPPPLLPPSFLIIPSPTFRATPLNRLLDRSPQIISAPAQPRLNKLFTLLQIQIIRAW